MFWLLHLSERNSFSMFELVPWWRSRILTWWLRVGWIILFFSVRQEWATRWVYNSFRLSWNHCEICCPSRWRRSSSESGWFVWLSRTLPRIFMWEGTLPWWSNLSPRVGLFVCRSGTTHTRSLVWVWCSSWILLSCTRTWIFFVELLGFHPATTSRRRSRMKVSFSRIWGCSMK